MKNILLPLAALALAPPALAQDEAAPEPAPAPQPAPAPSPSDHVNAAGQNDWVVIAPEDMLVMTLANAADGTPRRVVIQLMPKPFSQGWVENIRTLARAKWYDGTSINRVQDNYVVQWGDPNYDNPESGGEAKALPDTLRTMREGEYVAIQNGWGDIIELGEARERGAILSSQSAQAPSPGDETEASSLDAYAEYAGFIQGWPVGFGSAYTTVAREIIIPKEVAERMFDDMETAANLPIFGQLNEDDAKAAQRIASSALTAVWPVHCYGMVGVGRNYSPDTGSGAELYTVIGHAPRHLDRNIALVGRILGG
ncbi:MAG: peptidylprolyl isomerase, partial [Pseudomonadota bacterium]